MKTPTASKEPFSDSEIDGLLKWIASACRVQDALNGRVWVRRPRGFIVTACHN